MGTCVSGRAVDATLYKRAMRKVPSAVTVVTAAHQGERRGLTATAVCSVSAEPPSILVCVHRQGRAHDWISRAPFFAVNYLADGQDAIARRFSVPTDEHQLRFSLGEWVDGHTEAPILASSMVAFECQTTRTVDFGTHTIFVGKVAFIHENETAALLYQSGEFTRTQRIVNATSMRLAYQVSTDLRRSVDFYQQALGLELRFVDGDRWAEFSVGNTRFALASPDEAPEGRQGAVVVFECEDLETTCESVRRAGGSVLAMRDMGSHGHTATIRDPEGAVFQLFSRSASINKKAEQ